MWSFRYVFVGPIRFQNFYNLEWCEGSHQKKRNMKPASRHNLFRVFAAGRRPAESEASTTFNMWYSQNKSYSGVLNSTCAVDTRKIWDWKDHERSSHTVKSLQCISSPENYGIERIMNVLLSRICFALWLHVHNKSRYYNLLKLLCALSTKASLLSCCSHWAIKLRFHGWEKPVSLTCSCRCLGMLSQEVS